MTSSDSRMQEGYERDSRNMMWLFGQFLMIPASAFLYGVEMMLKTMQGMQQVTSQGVEVMVGPNAFTSTMPDASTGAANTLTDSNITNTSTDNNRIPLKEDKKLMETNQNFCKPDPKDGKCLVLWRYKVLFIKRDFEHAFPEQEDLIPDDVTDITAWKIAEFIQQLGHCKVEVPRKWIEKRYPNPKKYWRTDCHGKNGNGEIEDVDEAAGGDTRIYLVGLPEEDKKFLRLYSQQLASYARQDPKYEERQIEVLEQIRDRL